MSYKNRMIMRVTLILRLFFNPSFPDSCLMGVCGLRIRRDSFVKAWVFEKVHFVIISVFMLVCSFSLQVSAQDAILDAMKTEADRSLTVLKRQPVPAYYISYLLQDNTRCNINTVFGHLQSHERNRQCQGKVMVRVGNHELDNTRKVQGANIPFANDGISAFLMSSVPIDEQSFGLKMLLWQTTNRMYQNEVKRFESIKAIVGTNAAASDLSDDFSIETPEDYYEAPVNFDEMVLDVQKWEEKLRMYSRIFCDYKDLTEGAANISIELVRKYFVDTDGAVIAQNRFAYRLMLMVKTIANDGMELPLFQSYFALEQKDLPSDATIMADAQRIGKLAAQLRNAPVAESYSGPAIISAKASGVFFHEIFGHRIEGSLLKQEQNEQTFKKKVGEVVLPKDISVVFDPQLKVYKGIPLNGGYVVDDEGVHGQRVEVVKNGVLKSFLMNRTPIEGFSKSNGHGRCELGLFFNAVESRQSNMLIESTKPQTEDRLRKMLKDEIRRTGKKYGYMFEEVSGGFTLTGRIIPNAFNVTPLIVYRIYADGRPDELVRGIDLIGTPLAMFSQISACGDKYDVFNGNCGSTSGLIPVSCAAPSLFVKMIETQKKPVSMSKPSILERP